jgi:arylsulfatase A-like enzyme
MPTTTVNGSSNAPLRGSKRQTWEGGIRVAFVMKWKGRLEAGSVEHRPII